MDLIGKRVLFHDREGFGSALVDLFILELTHDHIRVRYPDTSERWFACEDFHRRFEIKEILN